MTQLTTYFSVIVPVYNGAGTLDDCLTAIVNQNYPQDKYEIIVVNDGSIDETAEIASRYPVRLINLETNQGRIVARNTGARAAKYNTLVFNDVRVFPEQNLLTTVSKRNYQPLMPNAEVYRGQKWGFSRLFHLLRCKIYAPYYPLERGSDEFEITIANFDRAPKGLTTLVCDRDLWLASQPKVFNKFTNDDTPILRKMVEYAPIVRTISTWVSYTERTDLNQVLRHIFERGPRFADFYLHPGGRYFLPYVAIWFLLGLIIFGAVLQLTTVLLSVGWLLLGLGLIIVIFLSQTWLDLLVVSIYLPIIAGAFGLGILKWQIIQFFKLSHFSQNSSLRTED